MRRLFTLCLMIITLLALAGVAGAQMGKQYEGPDDPAGDKEAIREGMMNGNNVLLQFSNTTELSDCCDLGYWVSRWPNDYSGSKMNDGIAVLLGGRIYVENDSIPVTDLNQIRTRNDLDTLYYCQGYYREGQDTSPDGNVIWGLYPVFGYFNEANPTPAMSNKPESWPTAGWPATGDEKKWAGTWNGRFGLGIMKADLESYFVANDAQDQEYLGPEDKIKYYPRPGVKIGDKGPMPSIQYGLPWGGLGLRVEVRGFQWKNPEAADCIFWEYTIANISDYDIPEMYFGYHIDMAVGGEEYHVADDVAYYEKSLDMAYTWDFDGEMVGGGGVPGCMGIAFLESPGVSTDGKDNDDDGLIDEKRDNVATKLIGPTAGIADITKFTNFYGKDDDGDGIFTFEFKEHWDADEDQDWRDGIDTNGDGIYQKDEFPGDDVGTDGSGPFDLDYPGPDANGTEGNHRPDLQEGIGSEPSFGFTDVGESDMLGLTSFRYNLNWGIYLHKGDEEEWYFLTEGIFDQAQTTPINFCEQFATGVFTLHQGRTERISMSELHALERLHEQSAPPYSAPALFKLKEVVQYIYETDYQFAQPPLMPTLQALPGDGKVFLSWDDISQKYTYEPLLNNLNDFEGYKLYKSTDPYLSDDKVITDGFGTPTLIKPIFECDIVDGKKGFTDFGLVNGAAYYLGTDNGITNYYIDTDVTNGMTYYYVLVAYDYGINSGDIKVGPSFNTYTLNIGRDETVEEVSKNVAIVKPHQYSAGYLSPSIKDFSLNNAFGKNTAAPEVVFPPFVKPDNTYKVKFGSEITQKGENLSHGLCYLNNSIKIYDVTGGDLLIYEENDSSFSGDNFEFYRQDTEVLNYKEGFRFRIDKPLKTAEFDGLMLNFMVPTREPDIDWVNSGWIKGGSPIRITQPTDSMTRIFPYDYNIIFTDNPAVYTGKAIAATMKDEDFGRLDPKELLIKQPFSFYVETPNLKDSTGANYRADLAIHDVDRNGKFDWLTDRVLVGFVTDMGRRKNLWAGLAFIMDFQNAPSEATLPKPGDSYRLAYQRGFAAHDSITFTTVGARLVDESSIKEEMEKIMVVPNPYVVTNAMEPAIGNWERNQPRRIMFTHVPAQCNIKIFTISGLLVDEMEVNNAVSTRTTSYDSNSEANGTAFWDLRTKEGLDIAAGYYIYRVESTLTGDIKMGKFAVIK